MPDQEPVDSSSVASAKRSRLLIATSIAGGVAIIVAAVAIGVMLGQSSSSRDEPEAAPVETSAEPTPAETTATVALSSSPGAWGVDSSGGNVIPVSGSWVEGNPSALAPGNAVTWTAQSSVDYDADTAGRVARWITRNSGHMLVQWSNGVPAGCSAAVPINDAR